MKVKALQRMDRKRSIGAVVKEERKARGEMPDLYYLYLMH